MKTIPLQDIHIQAGARMAPFAGYNMPVEYSGIINEHLNVRNHAGIFDVSHMGEVWVRGQESLGFLQKVTTNDVSKLYPGKVQYSCLPNGKGGIVDDILVYRYEELKYLLVINASNIDKDWNWLNKNKNGFKIELENPSDNTGILAVQGPNSLNIVRQVVKDDLKNLEYYHFLTSFINKNEVIVSRTGYTGELGFEIFFNNESATEIWQALMNAGATYNLRPAGLAARDTLRLEMGYCLYGNDINDNTSPIEAGLGWITKFNENKNFIDKEILFEQKQNGIQKKLRGFELLERGIPRKDYVIFSEKNKEIGKVTSGTMSPSLGKGIGMGYVDIEFASPGQEIFIEVRNRLLKARVVELPFYKKD